MKDIVILLRSLRLEDMDGVRLSQLDMTSINEIMQAFNEAGWKSSMATSQQPTPADSTAALRDEVIAALGLTPLGEVKPNAWLTAHPYITDDQLDAIMAAAQDWAKVVIGPDCEHHTSFVCNDHPIVSATKVEQRRRAGLPEQDGGR